MRKNSKRYDDLPCMRAAFQMVKRIRAARYRKYGIDDRPNAVQGHRAAQRLESCTRTHDHALHAHHGPDQLPDVETRLEPADKPHHAHKAAKPHGGQRL